MVTKASVIPRPEKAKPEYRYFEGIDIQWNRVPWNFNHPEIGPVSIDTYSIWNPVHHAEIAERLVSGERVALYMMGNFGVAEFRVAPRYRTDKDDKDVILDDIKQRERMQNLLVFAHPDDIQDYIDFDRLPPAFKDLQKPEKILALYVGPMHGIFPIKDKDLIDQGLVKQDDKTAAFFWIPGHWAYQNLFNEVKKRSAKGHLGGGSLNIHGQEPCYTTADLRDGEMVKHKEWLENIDFVILDEIAEATGIGRSHTQVSFAQDPARIVRIGALSPAKIKRETGLKIVYNDTVKKASSKTPYDNIHNADADRKVEIVQARIARFQAALSRGSRSSGSQI